MPQKHRVWHKILAHEVPTKFQVKYPQLTHQQLHSSIGGLSLTATDGNQDVHSADGPFRVRQQTDLVKRHAAIMLPLCRVTTKIDGLVASADVPSLLFAVRSLKMRSHAGEVSFPGGLHEAAVDGPVGQEKSMQNAAKRETLEELYIEDLTLVHRLLPLSDKTGRITVSPYVATLHKPIVRHYNHDLKNYHYDQHFNRNEVADVFTVALQDLMHSDNVGYQSFKSTGGLVTCAYRGALVPPNVHQQMLQMTPDY